MTMASPSEITSSQRAASQARASGGHSFWLASRAALPIELFRSISGALLFHFFLRGLLERAPLLLSGFLGEALASSALRTAPAWAIQAAFVAGCLLSLCLALNLFTRAAAALLLVLSVLLQHALFQLGHLDDWIATVLCFWLMLLPGQGSPRTWRMGQRAQRRVPGLVVSLLLLHVLGFYTVIQLWAAFSPLWQAEPAVNVVAALVPALYLLPLMAARRGAALLQIGLHGYLALHSGELLTHGVLMATSLLFWGEALPPKHDHSARELPVIDLAATLAGCYSATLSLWVVALLGGADYLAATTTQILYQAGLHPPLLTARLADVAVTFVASEGRVRAWPEVPGLPAHSHLSTRMLLTEIAAGAFSSAQAGRDAALRELRVAARVYCMNKLPSERPVTITIAERALTSGTPLPVARFHCYDPDESLQWLTTPAAPTATRSNDVSATYQSMREPFL